MAATGTPSNVARCIVPVSFVKRARHPRNSSINSSNVVWPIRFEQLSPSAAAIVSPIALSFFVPNKIHLVLACAEIAAAASAKRSGNHRLAGPYSAPGQRPSVARRSWRDVLLHVQDARKRVPPSKIDICPAIVRDSQETSRVMFRWTWLTRFADDLI